ncbi:MAG: aspartyl protease family protein [Candidatus Eremiobacteraeota bacterium]|nr:aspartyl protease family protein [Candidatus Eremiobacteraeota bacterium]
MRRTDARALALALACVLGCLGTGAAAARADTHVNADPPAGIVPTTMTLQELLASHAKAVGDASRFHSDVEEGDIVEYGIKGTYRAVWSKHDGWRESVQLGVLSYQSGKVNGQHWRQNENGQVIALHDVHPENAISEDAISKAAPTTAGGVRLMGEVAFPFPAYVVEINPKGGRHEWRFYDKQNYLLERTEAIYPTRRAVTTYSDFHTVQGITEAWHVHESDGHPQNDADWAVRRDTFDAAVSAHDLEAPPNNAGLVQFPTGKRSLSIPVRIVNSKVIVRLQIGGRGLDFFLDSGASGIAIDTGIAHQLGLQPLGREIATTAGVYEASRSLIPEIRIGDLVMHNVVVESLPFTSDPDEQTRSVGLLGFDFISNAALTIDYQHSTLVATQPGFFIPPADAIALEALLDDGVPYISAQVGNAIGTHFILDTGAAGALIYSSFASAHPDDVKDEGKGGLFNRNYPFLRGSGVGGELRLKAIEVKSFALGGINFQDWLMYQTVENPGFESEDNDGLIGYDLLRYFTLYLDYHDSRVYLQPNDLLKHNSAAGR